MRWRINSLTHRITVIGHSYRCAPRRHASLPLLTYCVLMEMQQELPTVSAGHKCKGCRKCKERVSFASDTVSLLIWGWRPIIEPPLKTTRSFFMSCLSSPMFLVMSPKHFCSTAALNPAPPPSSPSEFAFILSSSCFFSCVFRLLCQFPPRISCFTSFRIGFIVC